jgi:uncharacterized protein
MAAPPLTVSIAALRRGHEHRRREQRSGPIPGLHVTGSSVPAGEEVDLDVMVELVDGGVVVTGTVGTRWAGECRRCLKPVEGRLVLPVRELYQPHSDRTGAGADDEETYPLEGDQLDLLPLARDAVLLELPQAPLCRPDCAGLCPTCGTDLNAGPCPCRPAPADPRWSALDALRPEPNA